MAETTKSGGSEVAVPATQDVLGSLGYELEWRIARDVSCVVTRERERWTGTGATRAEALASALAAMLPSHAARTAFTSWAQARPPSEAPPAGDEPQSRRVVTRNPGVIVREDRSRRSSSQQIVVVAEPAVVEPSTPPRPISVEDALAELGAVRARIEDALGDVALMAPALQRLHVLAWICRARSIEERHPHDRTVQQTTLSIARRLTHLCKIWWPGNVRALQLHTTPDQAARTVEPQPRPIPTRWDQLADVIEQRLEAAVAGAGFDDGWQDGAALSPPPADRAGTLAKVRGAVERIGGALESLPVDRSDSLRVSDQDVEVLLECGRRLRWLRGTTSEPQVWGSALGRMRFVVTGLGDRGTPLKALLDPAYRPRTTWADAFEQRQRDELFKTRPPLEPRPGFIAWLVGLFDQLSAKHLAEGLADAKETLLTITDKELGTTDKKAKKKLKDLHAALEGKPVDEPAEAPSQEAAAEGSSDAIVDEVLAQIKAKLPAQQALFVSNREDPELREKLEKSLGLTITWCVSDPKRLDAAAKAVQKHTYDLVLSATGFQDHSADSLLSRAAAAATPRVMYVRVNRGRLPSVARALAREVAAPPPV